MTSYRKLFLAALVLTGIGSTAYAATDGHQNDAMAVTNARLSLTQAVTAAEQRVHGRASKVEYEQSRQGWVYDVEVVKDKQVYDVKVDANQGNILASTQDKVDRDDERDMED